MCYFGFLWYANCSEMDCALIIDYQGCWGSVDAISFNKIYVLNYIKFDVTNILKAICNLIQNLGGHSTGLTKMR